MLSTQDESMKLAKKRLERKLHGGGGGGRGSKPDTSPRHTAKSPSKTQHTQSGASHWVACREWLCRTV